MVTRVVGLVLSVACSPVRNSMATASSFFPPRNAMCVTSGMTCHAWNITICSMQYAPDADCVRLLLYVSTGLMPHSNSVRLEPGAFGHSGAREDVECYACCTCIVIFYMSSTGKHPI